VYLMLTMLTFFEEDEDDDTLAMVACEDCDGTGRAAMSDPFMDEDDAADCPSCHGFGRLDW
jgi:DnaJ-class molecular chaperone